MEMHQEQDQVGKKMSKKHTKPSYVCIAAKLLCIFFFLQYIKDKQAATIGSNVFVQKCTRGTC